MATHTCEAGIPINEHEPCPECGAMSADECNMPTSAFNDWQPTTRQALQIAIDVLMGGIDHNQATRDAATAVLHMIRDQQGCEHFGEADTLPEFIDVIVFG